jgi:Ser/Thr protein kinase RdoA (MazF antagonist)
MGRIAFGLGGSRTCAPCFENGAARWNMETMIAVRARTLTAFDDELSKNCEIPSLDQAPTSVVNSDDEYFRQAMECLRIKPQRVETSSLHDVLHRHYGVQGSISVLNSEVEHTAEVELPAGNRLILKTSSEPQALESFRFQSSTIAKLGADPDFIVPQILATSSGTLMFEEPRICGYVQSRLDGRPVSEMTISPDLLYKAGRALGKLDLALRQIEVPGIHRPILWHIKCWPRLQGLEAYLPSGPIAESVRRTMRSYTDFVQPRLGEVEWQITHNDPSPFNMLVASDRIAFIDFGDGCWGPRIQDLAIAASHFVRESTMALGGAEYLIAGYTAVLPLSPLETSLLVELMRARQSALILVNYWRSHLFPTEAAYIKKNVARAEHGLSILSSLSRAEAEVAVERVSSHNNKKW